MAREESLFGDVVGVVAGVTVGVVVVTECCGGVGVGDIPGDGRWLSDTLSPLVSPCFACFPLSPLLALTTRTRRPAKLIDQTGHVMFRNALTAFAMIFPAELPDKSMFATLVLTSRFRRPAMVWFGVAAAFAMHVTVAVTAGSLIHRLPTRLVGGATAMLFAVGALLLWRESGEPLEAVDPSEQRNSNDAADAIDKEGDRTATKTSARMRTIVLTSFVTVGLAEWGDLTQLATASLAADRGDPVAVGVGAFAALLSVSALAAFVGRWILRVVPLRAVRRIAAALFAALAIWTLFELV
jgi:Ca2+/H+ antiporter, TMEM165/GDT1 family